MAFDSAKATSRRGPWTSARIALTSTGMKAPMTPNRKQAPMLTKTAGASVSPMAAAAEPSVAAISVRPRPRRRTTRSPNRPTITMPAAIALVCRLTSR